MCNKCDKKSSKYYYDYQSYKRSFQYYSDYQSYKKSFEYYYDYQSYKKSYNKSCGVCYTVYKKSYKYYQEYKAYKKSYKYYSDFKCYKKKYSDCNKYICKKYDCRKKDWKEDDCYEEKDYNIDRKYYVVEKKYLVEEKKYDDCDKYDTKTKAVYCEKPCDDKKDDSCDDWKYKKSCCPKKECCIVDKKLEDELVCLWKKFTDDVQSSIKNDVILIAHNLPVKITNTINGLVSKSPLITHGLYTVECSNGKYINLYKILIPDIPGCNGEDSTGKIFSKILSKNDIYVDGDSFHWKGHEIVKEQSLPNAIHIVKIDMHPVFFTRIIIKALKKTLAVIKARSKEI